MLITKVHFLLNGLFCISPEKFQILPASKVGLAATGIEQLHQSVVLQVIEIQWPSS